MVKIAFWDNFLCERGTTVGLYDYAFFNKELLGNESIIIYDKNGIHNNNNVIEKFSKEFDMFSINTWDEVDNILIENNCDILFVMKMGYNDNHYSKKIKTVIHCVGCLFEPHGDVYTSVCRNLKGIIDKYPVIPHMINLPKHNEDMRKELNIPENATVFGRHGGRDSFDIKYVQNIVYDVALKNPNIYFLFLNTDKFCNELPNIIHINTIVDLNEKVKFINTCDAMIWARDCGESFGLSIAEFSVNNKPVLATKSYNDNTHVEILGEKGIWYNESNLEVILTKFNKEEAKNMDWNAYKEYTPEKVMKIFKSICID